MRSRLLGVIVGLIIGLSGAVFAQSWTAPRTWVAGELVTPTIMNSAVRDNLTVLRAGGVAMTSQAANDLVYASSSTQFARVAGAASSVLVTSAGSVPSLSTTLPSGLTIPAPVFSGTITGTYTVGGTPTLPLISSTNYPATTSAQLAGVISNETGTNLLVFSDSPALVTPNLGTPSAAVLTNATGLPIATGLSGLSAANRIPYATSATALTTSANLTYDGANTFTYQGTSFNANSATASFDRVVIAEGTITSNVQPLSATVTWNAGGVTFTALKLDVTNTASAADSLLLDLQVGSTSKFKVDKDGDVTAVGDLSVAAVTSTGTGSISGPWTFTGDGRITAIDSNNDNGGLRNALIFQRGTGAGTNMNIVSVGDGANGVSAVRFRSATTDLLSVSSAGNAKIAGTAARATTEGTNHLDIFDGTAPVGTLANGISLYSTAGELRVMDAAGNATLLSPHDDDTNEWIFFSKNTVTGEVIRIDMERLMRRLDKEFGGGFIDEYTEDPQQTPRSVRRRR